MKGAQRNPITVSVEQLVPTTTYLVDMSLVFQLQKSKIQQVLRQRVLRTIRETHGSCVGYSPSSFPDPQTMRFVWEPVTHGLRCDSCDFSRRATRLKWKQ